MTDTGDDLARDDAERVALAEQILGLEFSDKDLLRTALTHPSHMVSEHDHAHYERLEFLGDAVLGFLMTDYLFSTYPDLPEGRMTKIRSSFVSGRALARVADALGLGEAVIVGHGAETIRERHTRSMLADSFEAVLAAIYLEHGLEEARRFLFAQLTPEIIETTISEAQDEDPKNLLQEHTQGVDGQLPEYRIIAEKGPPHDRTFTAEVRVAGRVAGVGEGASKKEAQRQAAERALETLLGVGWRSRKPTAL